MKRRNFLRLLGILLPLGIPCASRADHHLNFDNSTRLPQESYASKKTSENDIINLVGVGGAGANTVENMIRMGDSSFDFICANSDTHSLNKSSAETKLQFGKSGTGSGGSIKRAQEWAFQNHHSITEAVTGAHMVIITAGMGGGTGTGAAPVVAQVAQEHGIFTIAVVTEPFEYENRMKTARRGISVLSQHVDALVIIPNEELQKLLGDDVTMKETFRFADAKLREVITCLAESDEIHNQGNVGVEKLLENISDMKFSTIDSKAHVYRGYAS